MASTRTVDLDDVDRDRFLMRPVWPLAPSSGARWAAVDGAVLAVSQFTLYGNVRKGRRPSFTNAARPDHAQPLYEKFCALLEAEGLTVERGVFQAEMKVALINDGPVTLWLDTDDS